MTDASAVNVAVTANGAAAAYPIVAEADRVAVTASEAAGR
jgi:hypothetical protein